MNYFVTGTDTGVGKTLVSCALLHGFAAQGKRVAGMKPVAAGCDDAGHNEDMLQLRSAGNVTAGYGQINPYSFVPAIAPHLAAQQSGVIIQFSRIAVSYQELAGKADVVIVEGAGGFLVPLNEQQDSADLVMELGLPVILVVGMRLGCLNHALLTVEAIAARGLVLAGWVANVLDADMPALQQNIDTLRQRIAAPLLGIVPYLPQADARVAAGSLDLERLYNGHGASESEVPQVQQD
ncbi:MAG: dethiobiotin synthase [Gallionella sp.]